MITSTQSISPHMICNWGNNCAMFIFGVEMHLWSIANYCSLSRSSARHSTLSAAQQSKDRVRILFANAFHLSKAFLANWSLSYMLETQKNCIWLCCLLYSWISPLYMRAHSIMHLSFFVSLACAPANAPPATIKFRSALWCTAFFIFDGESSAERWTDSITFIVFPNV